MGPRTVLYSVEKKILYAPAALASNTERHQGVCNKHSVSVYRSVSITISAMSRWGNQMRHNIHHHRTNHNGVQHNISVARRWRAIGRYIIEFFEDTTIQGLRHIVAANTHPLET